MNNQDQNGAPILKENNPVQIDPNDLIDLWITDIKQNRNGKITERKGQVKEQINDDLFRITFQNGKNKIYEYGELITLINKQNEDGEDRWTYDKIVDHKWSQETDRKEKIDVLVKWKGYKEPSWEPMEVIKNDDPFTLAKYAEDKGIHNQSRWKWTNKYLKNKKVFNRQLKRMLMAKKKRRTIKYQFGVRVPRTVKEAYILDSMNNDTFWSDAIKKEVRLLYEEYQCFKLHPKDSKIPEKYKKITLIWTFCVKYDGRRRARCVAGGHLTEDPEYDLYSGVVNLETVRIAFVAAILMKLQIIAADIGSAYIQAFTSKNVYVIAGPEFNELKGRILIIVKALYGLKTSGGQWHHKLADNISDMGFLPCQADFNFWIRRVEDHYEYIAVIVDDLLIFSTHPEMIITALKSVQGYTLNGVGIPEY
jgi:hypothetical protein